MEPPGVVTPILPVEAPAGTVAVIEVALTPVKSAGMPSNVTVVAPLKPVPEIVTRVPTGPDVGEKPVMAGGGTISTVKVAALLTSPPGCVTPILPVNAPLGTIAVICVDELTVYVPAEAPPKVTPVALLNPLPVMVTTVPTGPLIGLKPLIAGMTSKAVVLTPVPPVPVTEMEPLSAPAGTVAVIFVFESTVNEVAATPPNSTAVAPVKPVPVTVTVVPTSPDVGEKLVTVGPDTLKLATLVPVPLGVVTEIGPVVAPAGTVATMVVAVTAAGLKLADAPLNVTDVVPRKSVPVMVTAVPEGPETGEKSVMLGAPTTTTENESALSAVPPGVVTAILPEMAPAGTVALSWVALRTSAEAAVPLNVTAPTSTKFVPLMVTSVPMGPEPGEKLVMVGSSTTPKPPPKGDHTEGTGLCTREPAAPAAPGLSPSPSRTSATTTSSTA